METSAPPLSLCSLCRNLNLRLETFIDNGWRYPTSLDYESLEDLFDHGNANLDRHYVPGERLEDNRDYTDEQLASRMESPLSDNDFDEYGILVSLRPVKKKVLGRLGSIQERAIWCALCYLVCQISQSVQEEEEFNDSTLCKMRLDYVGQGSGVIIPSLVQVDRSLKYGRYGCTLSIGRREVELYPMCARPDIDWFGGRLYGSKINFDLVKGWIQACESSHVRCGTQDWQSVLKPMSALRLIDVDNMCLVDAGKHHRYVALSYVWGTVRMFVTKKTFTARLYLIGGLQEVWDQISRTIRDAIQVVRELGERYLWTDAICIVQDDAAEKAELIKDMDVVYARAFLSIVATEGKHANAGLPGIRPQDRAASEAVDVGNGLSLLPARAPIARTLLDCPWSTRAWTFQEGLLSSRQLMFTNSTVHLTCCSTTWSEDIQCLSEKMAPPWKYASGASFDFRPGLSEIPIQLPHQIDDTDEERPTSDLLYELWSSVVGNLSERKLSFETDILFAAAGMTSLLQKLFKVRVMYGLPERRIEQFLFWSPVEPGFLRRRCDRAQESFNPSWSWAGWVGEVSWPEDTAEPTSFSQEGIKWMGLENLDAQPVALECDGRGTARDDALMVTKKEHAAGKFLEAKYPLLHFRTRTGRFCIAEIAAPPEWIDELQTLAWSSVPANGKERSGVYCITTLDNENDIVGSVVLDTAIIMYGHQSLTCTFAIISSTHYQAEQYEGSHALTFWRVLALRYNGDVAERLGHGAILERAEADGLFKMETVILG